MLPLPEGLQAIAEILERSNAELEKDDEANATAFFPLAPQKLVSIVLKLLTVTEPQLSCLDLGCGNGGFALMAAAAGFPSFGIDINPKLIEHATMNYRMCVERNLIDASITCKFIVGDMILPEFRKKYEEFAREYPEVGRSMPQNNDDHDCYVDLGISISNANIVYCWSWPTQSRFLFNYLAETAKPEAIFVLPSYERYTQGEHMNASLHEKNELLLVPLAKEGETFIGRKITSTHIPKA
jgi:SAM-dependent methyltransferase